MSWAPLEDFDALATLIARETEADEARAAYWLKCADEVLSWCHPFQRDLCLDDSRRISVLTGGRSGKTTGISFRFLRRSLRVPRADSLYIATSRDQALDLLWAPMKDQLQQLDLLRECRFQEQTLRIHFPNRATLRLVGADDKKDIEKHRGIPRHEVWVDEAGSFDLVLLEWLLERVIGPRLGDYKGTLGIAGTPTHSLIGKFYDATRPGGLNRPYRERLDDKWAGFDGWSLHTWNAKEAAPYAPRIKNAWEEMEAEAARNGWADNHPVRMREHLGLWVADEQDMVFRYVPHLLGEAAKEKDLPEGTAWNQWDPSKNPRTGIAILPPVGRKDGWRYVWGIDLGAADPFALEVLAWNHYDTAKRLYHVYEYTAPKMYARAIAELLIGKDLNHEKPDGIVGAIGWPDGSYVDCAGLGENILEELLQVYGISLEPFPKAREVKWGAIELCNGDFVDGRLLILKGSSMEEQLTTLQWDKNDYGERQRNRGQRDDAADGLVMARAKAHHLLAEEAPKPEKRDGNVVEWEQASTPEQEVDMPSEPGEYDWAASDDPDVWG